MYDLSGEYTQLAKTADIDWGKLEGTTVLITGATCLIGASCLRLLMERNRTFESHVKDDCRYPQREES